MQTYTHFIITKFLNRKIRARQARLGTSTGNLPPLAPQSTLVGSVMPDAPLTLTFLVFLAMDLLGEQKIVDDAGTPKADMVATQSRVGHLFGHLFFFDWRMKLAHNLFHAPVLTLLYTLIGYLTWRMGKGQGKRLGAELFWFGASCTLHTAIDIPLHHDDGPLLFFPFNWQTRYLSPISYWDPKRYGKQFAVIEHLLLIGMVIWLVRDWWRTKIEAAAYAPVGAPGTGT